MHFIYARVAPSGIRKCRKMSTLAKNALKVPVIKKPLRTLPVKKESIS